MRALGLVLTLAVAAFGCYSSSPAGAAGAGGAGAMAGVGGEAGAGGVGGAGGAGGGGGASGACTDPADLDFLCSEDNGLRITLTACGNCSFWGAGCPTGCDGAPIAPHTSVALCAIAALGDPACDPRLSLGCLDCYLEVSVCTTINCSAPCTDDPAGCLCLDCVYDNCDAEFEACTGFRAGSSTTPGGPPTCEKQPTCTPPDPV